MRERKTFVSEYLERHFGPVIEQRTPRSYSALDPANSTGGPAGESQQGRGTAQASHGLPGEAGRQGIGT